MKKEDAILLGLSVVAVYMVVKSSGVKLPSLSKAAPLDLINSALNTTLNTSLSGDFIVFDTSGYNYDRDVSGALYSATGADVRARR